MSAVLDNRPSGSGFLVGDTSVRYSFHGKKRFGGQTIDGFIEARNSSEAIDTLAEEGVIGVYSVHPDPLPEQPKLLIEGNSSSVDRVPVEDETITLLDKLSSLVNQVEHILYHQLVSAPQTKPRRSTAPKAIVLDEQNAALRAICKDNVDLRRNLEQPLSAKTALKPNEKNQLAMRDNGPRTINIPSQPAA
jgi:hypothetical protein